MAAVKTESVSLKVAPEEKELLKKLAEDGNTTVSKMLYKIIFENLKKEKNA